MSHSKRIIGAIAIALAAPAIALGGTISGTVYGDFNSNGTLDTGTFSAGPSGGATATDVGVAGVLVKAYDNTGALTGSATSGANGTYSLTTAASGTVRVEFTTPAGYQPSFSGARNGTSVQFVNATATGVDFGVLKPADYCQDNPKLVTCLFPFLGNTAPPGAITVDSGLGQLDITSDGRVRSVASNGGTQVNTTGQLGATFGVGVDRGGNAYFGTYVKRHSPYGSGGASNNVYKVNIATGATSVFTTLGNSTLPAHVAASPGGWPDYAADGLRMDNNTNDVFHMVGRAGLGDVDVTPDGSTLYAVEMTEGNQTSTWPRLWTVPINGTGAAASAGTPVSYDIQKPATFGGVACNGKWHPMGIGMSASTVLVGGVCGNESAEPSPRSYTVTSSEGVAGGGGMKLTLSSVSGLSIGDHVSISDLSRGDNFLGIGGSPFNRSDTTITAISGNVITYASTTGLEPFIGPAATTGTVNNIASYATAGTSAFVLNFDTTTHAFTTIAAVSLDYPKAAGTNFDVMASFAGGGSAQWHSWNDWDNQLGARSPQVWSKPMLANIETRADGSLALVFRDRWMDQSAGGNTIDYDSTPSNIVTSDGLAAGEILLLCKNGSSYVKETNAACGSTIGANNPGLLSADPTNRAGSPLFYWNGFSLIFPYGHPYTGQGGAAMMPGAPTLWTTAWDISSLYQQGVRALGPCAARAGTGNCGPSGVDDGALVAGQVLSFNQTPPNWPQAIGPCDNDCWAKGNGLGDLEVACDAAPVQIGNRVWIDTNGNGIQDPGEPPVVGVTVHLYDSGNALVGTAITDADGTYYFNSNRSEAAAGNGDNAGGGLTTGAAFTIRLDKPSDFAAGGALASYDITSVTQTSPGSGSQSTAVDSNATVVANYPQMSVPSRNAGLNNHTFDVGFAASANPPWPGAIVVGMGDTTWVDSNGNGVQDAGEPALPGVVVQLLDASGNVATDAQGNPVAPVTTDAQGHYFVGNLIPGSYKAQFTLPSGYAFTVTGGGTATTDSNPTAGANPLIGTTPVFTIAGSATGDTTSVAGNNSASFANLTIDAGVIVAPNQGSGSGGTGGSGATSGDGGSTPPAFGAIVPGMNPVIPFQATPSVTPGGIPANGTGRIVLPAVNPLDTPVGSMTTVIVIPRGFTIVSPGRGRVSGRTITFVDTNVPAKGRRTHTLYLRPAGKPRTAKAVVTVAVAGSSQVQRTVLRIKVRAPRAARTAVTG